MSLTIYIRDFESRILFLFEDVNPEQTIAEMISSFEKRLKSQTHYPYLRKKYDPNQSHELVLPDIIDSIIFNKLDKHKTLKEYKVKSKTTLLAIKK